MRLENILFCNRDTNIWTVFIQKLSLHQH